MENYVLEQDQFIRSVDISRNEAFSMFLGAGASITSGIPSAGDCIWEWKRNIYASKNSNSQFALDIKSEQSRQLIQNWLNSEGVFPEAGAVNEYGYYIEQCYPIEEDRRKYFQHICERKTPSVGYKLLSLLHEARIVRSVWTTNFDDLVRDAAITTGNVVIDITLDSVERIFRAQNDQELLLVKLHGDYKYGPLKNTDEELRRQDQTFRSKLIDYLIDKHLIVSGYSGRDESVMEALEASYSRPGAGRLYWCGRDRKIPPLVSKLIATARANGRTAYYIPTESFDSLLVALAAPCTKSDSILHKKFQEYTKAAIDGEIRTKFNINIPRINSVIKSNLFEVQFPQEVYQFEMSFLPDERPWSATRSLTDRKNVIAVPFNKKIWALGTLTDINTIFSARRKSKISRVPIADINIYKNTAIHSLLLASLTEALAQRSGLPSNKRDLIWKPAVATQRSINGTIYFTHQAIRLSIFCDGNRNMISLTPDFYISSEMESEPISKTIRQEIGRAYFEKLWNKQYNDYVNEWRGVLLPDTAPLNEIEYPIQSGSGFMFKIRKSPLFAGIYTETANGTALSNTFPSALLGYNGIKYQEPELLFSGRHTAMRQQPKDFHPMRGVSQNRPYDHEMASSFMETSINLGVICPQTDSASFVSFLKRPLSKLDYTGKNKDYIISYPGFIEAFSTSLNVPEPGTDYWHYTPEPNDTNTIKAAATSIQNQIIQGIDRLTADGIKKVIVIYIPDRWLDYTSYDLDNEHFDLHDFIKAYCAERSIATQFIQENTLADPLHCQINWWLSLSYFVKSLRTPWALDSLDKNTAFAGLGYSVKKQGDGHSSIVLGCSHIYNAQGQGLKYRLSKMQDPLFWDRNENPHLSYQDAYRLGLSTIRMFWETMNEFPKRVVIHKRTYFTQDEINGLKDSLLNNNVADLDLIEINYEDDARFVASKLNSQGMPDIDNFAVPRGTCILLNQYEALLWTHGVVPSVQNAYFKFYLGGRYIPGPLRIIKHFGKSNIGLIGNEILGLTKMNWNSFDLYSQLPATVNSSTEIARIGQLLSNREGVTYDYRFFI